MSKLNPREINTTALAFLGDAVYEVYVRKYVMLSSQNANLLHKKAIRYVCADGQAKAVRSLMKNYLSEEEISVVKRARNHKYTSKSRSADAVTYKMATAFESLIGYLYLNEDIERMENVIDEAIRRIEGKNE